VCSVFLLNNHVGQKEMLSFASGRNVLQKSESYNTKHKRSESQGTH
jgi:hypothetical protein